MTGRNPWAVLGVAEDTPYPEVQRAFRRRVKQTHPDGGGDAAEFATVVHAFEVVRRTLPRQRGRAGARPTPYDRWLRPADPPHSWTDGSSPAAGARSVPVPRRGASTSRSASADFSSVLAAEMTKARAVATPA